jgi:hypothetical protein
MIKSFLLLFFKKEVLPALTGKLRPDSFLSNSSLSYTGRVA